jgi:hypothetical protein
MNHRISTILLIILFQLQNIHAASIKINDINHALTKKETSILKTILNIEANFYNKFAHLPASATYNIRIAGKQQLKQYRILQSNSVSGIYSVAKKEAIIKKGRHMFRTMIHESNHFLISLRLKNIPTWVNEGLAEYFETTYISHNQAYAKVHHNDQKKLQQWHKTGQTPALASVLLWKGRSWYYLDYKSRKFSWGLIYFLMSTENGKQLLSKIIRETKKHRNKSSIMIIQANYKGGFEAFQKDFYAFLYRMPSKHKI